MGFVKVAEGGRFHIDRLLRLQRFIVVHSSTMMVVTLIWFSTGARYLSLSLFISFSLILLSVIGNKEDVKSFLVISR